MSFMETGDPSERIKKAFLAALMGGGADTGTQFALPDDGSGMPKASPGAASPSAGWNRDPGFTAKLPNFTGDPGMTAKLPDFTGDPGMSFPAPTNNFTLPPNTVSDLGGYAGPHSAPPVDTSRLDDLRAKSAAIPDNGVAPVHGLKDHLLNILKTLAPVAAGGMMFGLPGAAGAARGVEGAYQRKADLNIARKHSLESEAEQESQSVDKQRDFNTSLQERQREFDQRQQEIQGNQDFQREMLKSSTKGGEGKTVDTGNGVMQFNPDTNRYDIPVGPSKPVAGSESPYRDFASGDPTKQKAAKDFLTFEQGLKPKPEKSGEAGTWQLQEDDKGNTVEYNSKTGLTRPAPPGLKVKGGKANVDEQKRADLARNVSENLDQLEEIVKRKPELFGPPHLTNPLGGGRTTQLRQFFGSDDPDVAALKTIEHNLGMAVQGAHSMRSATGVAATGESLLNGFKNGPEAILGSTASMRKSLKTFTDDAARGGDTSSQSAAPAAQAKTTPQTHVFNVSRWKQANPGGDANAAIAEAKKAGYQVKQ